MLMTLLFAFVIECENFYIKECNIKFSDSLQALELKFNCKHITELEYNLTV